MGDGVTAAAAMALFYVVVVRGASGSSEHPAEQARADWYYPLAIIVGFGMHVAFVTELRRRHRLGSTAVPGAVGAGASTDGMIACCAHHLAELLPIIGAASVAGFLTDYASRSWSPASPSTPSLSSSWPSALRHHTAMHSHNSGLTMRRRHRVLTARCCSCSSAAVQALTTRRRLRRRCCPSVRSMLAPSR